MHIVLQPGIAFLESGFVRPKNAVDVAFRKYLVTGINISKLYYEKLNFICLQITAISALTYFLTGFALAFGDGNGFFGYDYFALRVSAGSRSASFRSNAPFPVEE